MPESEDTRVELLTDITDAVQREQARAEVKKIKALERYDPDSVVEILWRYSNGHSQNSISEKTGVSRHSIIRIVNTYADHFGKWKEWGGKLAADRALDLDDTARMALQRYREQIEGGQKVDAKDIDALIKAKKASETTALNARGEASQITDERHSYTVEDIEATRRAAIERAKRAREASAVDAEEAERTDG